MNEAQTRLDYIDPALKAAGWGEIKGSRIRVEFAITDGRIIGGGRRKQPLQADYVLEYRNKRLGIVEAKARDLHYTEGVGQAKDYAERLNIRYTYPLSHYRINTPSLLLSCRCFFLLSCRCFFTLPCGFF